jgi:hypothetical protein
LYPLLRQIVLMDNGVLHKIEETSVHISLKSLEKGIHGEEKVLR